MNLKGQPVRVGDLVHQAERAISPEVIAFYCDTFGDRNSVYARDGVAPPGDYLAVYPYRRLPH